MTGADVVGALLARATGLTALVPAERIKGGGLPQGVALPALVVRIISTTKAHGLRGRAQKTMARVQVTTFAPDYDTQLNIQDQVELACDGAAGVLAGLAVDDVVALGAGPDFQEQDGSIWMGSNDFRVTHS